MSHNPPELKTDGRKNLGHGRRQSHWGSFRRLAKITLLRLGDIMGIQDYPLPSSKK